jgi:ATP-dependent 26S proteasome regulatory subunit
MSQAIVAAETGERLIVNLLNSEDESRLTPGMDVSLGWKATSSYVIGSGTAGSAAPTTERTKV